MTSRRFVLPLAVFVFSAVVSGVLPAQSHRVRISPTRGVAFSVRPAKNRIQSARTGLSPSGADPFMFMPPVPYPAGLYADGVAVADVNGDGYPDLVVSNGCIVNGDCVCFTCYGPGGVSVLFGHSDGTFSSPVTYSAGGLGTTSLAVADLNGDNHPDVILANAEGSVSVLLGKSDGTFQTAVLYSSGGGQTQSVAVADVDGDGHPDVVVANWASHTVAVLLGNGNGTLQPPVTYDGGFDPDSVAIGDVNGDGHPDLVVADLCQTSDSCGSVGGISVLLGNGNGTFQAPVSYSTGAFPALSAVIGDVNGDGHPDLVAANQMYCGAYCSGGVGVLLNQDGTFATPIAYNAGMLYGNSVVIEDVDGDGRADLVVDGTTGGYKGIALSVVSLMLGNGDGTFQDATPYFTGEFTTGGVEENGDAVNAIAVADVNGDGKPDLLVANQCNSLWFSCDYGTVTVMLNNTGAPTTTMSLVSSLNPANLKQVVTYTATLSKHGGGTVNGAVTFADGVNPIATVTLTNNQATYTTSYGTGNLGAHGITATYPGILHQTMGSQATLTEYVRNVPTTTVLTTSGSPSVVGHPVTFTATVTPKHGSIPNGEQVTFYSGKTVLGTGTTTNGIASAIVSFTKAKTYTITAKYPGDNTVKPSSGKVTQVVTP